MTLADLMIKVVLVSVVFLMLGVGLRTAFGEVVAVGRRVPLVLRGVLANFLVFPALVVAVLLLLPLAPEVKIGIMLMAAAPVAPMAPPFVGMARGDVPYSVGLMTIVALLSVPLTPLILSVFLPPTEAGLTVDPLAIVKTLLTAQLIPIGIGMAIRQQSPRLADRLLKFVPAIGQIGLIVGVGLILVSQARQILSLSAFAHVILLALVVASLFIGDWMLIGDTPERRRALAVCTAIRNVPLAFLIAGENYPGTVVAPVVLILGTWSMIVSVAYGKLATRGQPAR